MGVGWNMETLTATGLLLIALSMVWSELWPYLKRLYLFLLLFPGARRMERSYLYLAYRTGKLTRRQYWRLARRRKIAYGPRMTFGNWIQPLVWDGERDRDKDQSVAGKQDLYYWYWKIHDAIQERSPEMPLTCLKCGEPIRTVGDLHAVFSYQPDSPLDELIRFEHYKCGGMAGAGHAARVSRERLKARVKTSSNEEWDKTRSMHPSLALKNLREISERSTNEQKE